MALQAIGLKSRPTSKGRTNQVFYWVGLAICLQLAEIYQQIMQGWHWLRQAWIQAKNRTSQAIAGIGSDRLGYRLKIEQARLLLTLVQTGLDTG